MLSKDALLLEETERENVCVCVCVCVCVFGTELCLQGHLSLLSAVTETAPWMCHDCTNY